MMEGLSNRGENDHLIKKRDEMLIHDSAQRYIIFISALIAFCVNILISAVSPFFPQYAVHRIGASTELVGLTIAMFPISSMLTSSFAGWSCAYFGQGFVATFGCIILSLGTALFGKSTNIASCMISRAIQGAGASAINVSTASLMMSYLGENFSSGVAIQQLFVGLGFILGPCIGGGLFEVSGFSATFLILAALPLFISFLIPFMLNLAHLPRSKSQKVFDSEISNQYKGISWREALLIVFRNESALACANCALLYSAAFGFLDSTFEKHMEMSLRTMPLLTGIAYALPAVTYSLCSLIVVRVVNKIGYCNCIALGLVINALSLWIIGPIPLFKWAFVSVNATWVLWVLGLFLMGGGIALLLVPALPAMQESIRLSLPKSCKSARDEELVSDATSAIYVCFMNIGEVLGPTLGAIGVQHMWQLKEVSCIGDTQECLSGFSCAATLFGIIIILCAFMVYKTVPKFLGIEVNTVEHITERAHCTTIQEI